MIPTKQINQIELVITDSSSISYGTLKNELTSLEKLATGKGFDLIHGIEDYY
ncbi:hypothetical protein ACFWMS_18095 [Peribacillus butanolivorans]|uniref:hypothetical protein n=1 Tax=Peribacillus butanolivorans TaxID=421767 RepID=UPI00365DF357